MITPTISFGFCWESLCNILFYSFCPTQRVICSEKSICECAEA
ncbi:Nodule Cysteine-Rich (NCR) secreted peptide [Caenorhabditis elegans]|uniref:Nodule Cysteine-Rich (NCR) secreted peptide n=1 Tax=Caenorhabditis elegans TaxID=6239 RepID=A0A1X7RBS4_CAEEL|nr:Nodule Cysteine-Rich (NCR) secreted peptide [Caenorhabditis elegans]SMQ11465.1 Nodule Cysteine-Rich (NCR) secreted peptide [Caenorhabditis elegans]|eukprot:NP_001338829.1 Uncharacterized protein CELE_Y38E10A.33 [Caenorhabditis elegans]